MTSPGLEPWLACLALTSAMILLITAPMSVYAVTFGRPGMVQAVTSYTVDTVIHCLLSGRVALQNADECLTGVGRPAEVGVGHRSVRRTGRGRPLLPHGSVERTGENRDDGQCPEHLASADRVTGHGHGPLLAEVAADEVLRMEKPARFDRHDGGRRRPIREMVPVSICQKVLSVLWPRA